MKSKDIELIKYNTRQNLLQKKFEEFLQKLSQETFDSVREVKSQEKNINFTFNLMDDNSNYKTNSISEKISKKKFFYGFNYKKIFRQNSATFLR